MFYVLLYIPLPFAGITEPVLIQIASRGRALSCTRWFNDITHKTRFEQQFEYFIRSCIFIQSAAPGRGHTVAVCWRSVSVEPYITDININFNNVTWCKHYTFWSSKERLRSKTKCMIIDYGMCLSPGAFPLPDIESSNLKAASYDRRVFRATLTLMTCLYDALIVLKSLETWRQSGEVYTEETFTDLTACVKCGR